MLLIRSIASLASAIMRSITSLQGSTSLSTFIVLLAIFIFGGETIRGFVFAIMLGVIVGTYSTLFVATPIAYELRRLQLRKKTGKEGENKA